MQQNRRVSRWSSLVQGAAGPAKWRGRTHEQTNKKGNNVNSADMHFKLVRLLCWCDDFADSSTALRRAIKLNPLHAGALVGLGHTLGGMSRHPEAKECFEKAVRLQPRNASAVCVLGWSASMEGRFEEAEQTLRRAVQFDAQCAEAWALLAELRRMSAQDKDWIRGRSGSSPRGCRRSRKPGYALQWASISTISANMRARSSNTSAPTRCASSPRCRTIERCVQRLSMT